MHVIINGEKTALSPDSTIDSAIKAFDLSGPFVVELNGEIIDSSNFETQVLKDEDIMEIIRFVGGG